MLNVTPFEERHLGATMDFGARSHARFPFSWASREELFRWKYMEQTQTLAHQSVPIWIVREGERVVGFLGAMVYDFWLAGQTLTGIAAMDFYLEDSCRGKGIGQRMLGHYEDSARLKLMILSSPQAHRIYLHRGYQELSGIHACYAIWGLQGMARWLKRKATRTRYDFEPSESADRIRSWLLGRPGISVVVEAEASAVDAFLGRALEHYQLAPRRLTRYLLWKYRQHPFRHGEVFVLREGETVKAVFALANRRLDGPPQLILGDLFLRRPDDKATIREVLGYCHRLTGLLGAHSTVIIDPGGIPGSILRRSTLTRAQPLLCSLKLDDADPWIEPALSYISGGDGDFIR